MVTHKGRTWAKSNQMSNEITKGGEPKAFWIFWGSFHVFYLLATFGSVALVAENWESLPVSVYLASTFPLVMGITYVAVVIRCLLGKDAFVFGDHPISCHLSDKGWQIVGIVSKCYLQDAEKAYVFWNRPKSGLNNQQLTHAKNHKFEFFSSLLTADMLGEAHYSVGWLVVDATIAGRTRKLKFAPWFRNREHILRIISLQSGRWVP